MRLEKLIIDAAERYYRYQDRKTTVDLDQVKMLAVLWRETILVFQDGDVWVTRVIHGGLIFEHRSA